MDAYYPRPLTFQSSAFALTVPVTVPIGPLRLQIELAGACFSSDGSVLFVNAFSPAATFAIRFPRNQGPPGSAPTPRPVPRRRRPCSL
ncbi:hypothetical protein EKN06_10185 [Croceicoccus ponticola]|uniref:Uncharacterized protein n=1 Tax=Croceicoccus ponticola TaxID=2217664 RepID=A0A437GWC1_9SPHN|nr:hypothetical protein EKN06_10185 [Croceicoccus ponticola]